MQKVVFLDQNISVDRYLSQASCLDTWVSVSQFKSKGRFITWDALPARHGHYGPRYQIIDKKKRLLSLKERLIRIFQALLAIIKHRVLDLSQYHIKKLLFDKHISVHFALPTSTDLFIKDPVIFNKEQKLISKTHLFQKLKLDQGLDKTLEKYMSSILHKQDGSLIYFYPSQASHRIFSLQDHPGLIFKINLDQMSHHPISDRYDKMLDAETTCRLFALHHLKVPACHMISLNYEMQKLDILIEEKLDFKSDILEQKKLFARPNQSTQDALAQLAFFICKTGYSDVEYRNNPILHTPYDDCIIGLIDLEHFESTPWGLFGMVKSKHGISRKGLVALCSQAFDERIFEIAKKQGLFGDLDDHHVFHYTNKTNLEAFDEAIKIKSEEQRTLQDLRIFYESAKITYPTCPIKDPKGLDENFIASFLPFYTRADQESYACIINKVISDFLKNTDRTLPFDLARLVSLNMPANNLDFKLFCLSYLSKLKHEGCIFDFKADPTEENNILVQC